MSGASELSLRRRAPGRSTRRRGHQVAHRSYLEREDGSSSAKAVASGRSSPRRGRIRLCAREGRSTSRTSTRFCSSQALAALVGIRSRVPFETRRPQLDSLDRPVDRLRRHPDHRRQLARPVRQPPIFPTLLVYALRCSLSAHTPSVPDSLIQSHPAHRFRPLRPPAHPNLNRSQLGPDRCRPRHQRLVERVGSAGVWACRPSRQAESGWTGGPGFRPRTCGRQLPIVLPVVVANSPHENRGRP